MKININDLRPHEEQVAIYGEDLDLNAKFVNAIRDKGDFLDKVVITYDNRIVSGNRRVGAARQLGWTEVEVEVFESRDETEILKALLCYNMHRVKTNLALVQEAMRHVVIFKEEGKKGMARGGVESGKVRAGEGRSESDPPSQSGKSTDKVAKVLDITKTAAFQMVKIGKALQEAQKAKDADKEKSIKTALNKSFNAAWNIVNPPEKKKSKPPTPTEKGARGFTSSPELLDEVLIPLKNFWGTKPHLKIGKLLHLIVEAAKKKKPGRLLEEITNKEFNQCLNNVIKNWR